MPLAPATKESYLGAFLENIIYGFYLSAFVECCTLFWMKKKRREAKQKYVIITAILMFILITMRCIIDTYRCVAAFDADDAEFGIGAPNSTLALLTNACWFFLTPIADAFIIFRTFIVWNRNWHIIILPSILCLANFGSCFWVIIALSDLNMGLNPSVWHNVVYKSINLFLSLTLCTNVICTALIAFRILRIHRQLRWMSTSAAIYTLLLIATLISNSVSSYVNFILFNCTPPTIGLVFSYIIIRVSRGTSCEENATSTETMRFRRAPQTMTQAHEMAVQIRLEREVETQAAGPHDMMKHADMDIDIDRTMV
ncbi:hypothetical protein MSAN_02007300 [Mycena sanguinolenta]|uniref:Uncharacterized protein n=1 Tax=Mycena sanguinolenta TaxID=230812 RepID=A0A8H7CM79_9AGAR|nr:hypothetical protein MSAN_02007300 [Mycena sanguinolenta]